MSVDYGPVILRALADIRRRQILLAKLNTATDGLYPDAFAYAVLHRVYPAYHEEIPFGGEGLTKQQILELSPFHDTYNVEREQVVEIAELLDSKWLAKEHITYYDVEGEYQHGEKRWKGDSLRDGLITTCRYLFLHGMFDKPFWIHLMSEAPTEAYDVMHDWKAEEIRDWAQL